MFSKLLLISGIESPVPGQLPHVGVFTLASHGKHAEHAKDIFIYILDKGNYTIK